MLKISKHSPLSLWALILMLLCPLAWAQDAGLSEAQVKQWIQHRLELANMQFEMMADPPSGVSDLPRAFARKRRGHLEKNYGEARFDAHKQRIWDALDALDALEREAEIRADMAELQSHIDAAGNDPMQDPQTAAMIAEMRSIGLPEDQVQDAIAALRAASAQDTQPTEELLQEMRAAFEAARKDWSGVRPWRYTLNHLTAWYARNRPDPPVLD